MVRPLIHFPELSPECHFNARVRPIHGYSEEVVTKCSVHGEISGNADPLANLFWHAWPQRGFEPRQTTIEDIHRGHQRGSRSRQFGEGTANWKPLKLVAIRFHVLSTSICLGQSALRLLNHTDR